MSQPESSSNLKVHAMFERFAKAFTSGDGHAAKAFWEVPALVVADMGTKAVATLKEVETFYGGAAEQYRSRGITGTSPEVLDTNWLTDKLAIVTVRWPWLDDKGHRTSAEETSTYIVRVGDDGEPRITVAVMHGKAG